MSCFFVFAGYILSRNRGTGCSSTTEVVPTASAAAVEPAQKYTVEDLDADLMMATTGQHLHENLPLILDPGQEKHLTIRPICQM